MHSRNLSRSSRPHPRWAVALGLTLTLAAAGCSEKINTLGSNSLRDRLDANWDLWQSWTEPDYEFDFRWDCFCLAELTAPVRVQVVDHVVTNVTYLDDGTPVDPDFLAIFPTIAQLFFTIEQAIDDDADVIHVEFHEDDGYPVSANLDYDAQAADDELGFTVGNLVLGVPTTGRGGTGPRDPQSRVPRLPRGERPLPGRSPVATADSHDG